MRQKNQFGQAVGPNPSGHSWICLSFTKIFGALNPYAGVQLAAPAKCQILSMKRPLSSQKSDNTFPSLVFHEVSSNKNLL